MRLALLALLLMGCQSLTDVVVRVDADSAIVGEIASVSITVTDVDGSDGGTQVYASQALPVCAAGQHDACYSFPITVTLKPGAHAPDTKVRVQVDAKMAMSVPFSSDAALFTFTPHTEKSLDFFLSPECKTSHCATANLACVTSGMNSQCGVVTAKPGDAPPDLSTPPPPATSVSLVSSQPGLVEPMSMQPYSIARPDLASGDLLVLAMLIDGGNSGTTPPAGWTILGQIDRQTEVLYRVADGTEQASTTLFEFTAPDFGSASLQGSVFYEEYVFRGAVLPIRSAMASQVVAGPDQSFQVMLDSAGQLGAGGVLAAIGINDNNGFSGCTPTPPVTVQTAKSFLLLQLAGIVGGQPSPLSIPCTDQIGNSVNWVYTFVLNPAQ